MKHPVFATILFTAFISSVSAATGQNLPPLLRPGTTPVSVPSQPTTGGVATLVPRLRPGPAAPQFNQPTVTATTAIGPICRDRGIRGQVLAPIGGTAPGCQVARPVRVHSIDGVLFEPAAVMTCETAAATKDWVQKSAIPAWGRLGGGLARIDVATSFACQSVSNREAHARGTAIDIDGFRLKNGLRINVESGWRDPVAGKILREVHKAGCKSFKTGLGPDAGGGTRDHLHFDTADGRRKCR